MREAPKSKPKAILQVEKRKVFIFNLAVAFTSFAVFALGSPFIEPGLRLAAGTALIVIFAAITYRSWKYLLRAPSLALHETGIDFSGFGYMDWRDFSFDAADDELGVFTVWRESGKPPRKGKLGADVLYLNKKTGFLTIRLRFPKWLSNTSLEEFSAKALAYYEPGVGHSFVGEGPVRRRTLAQWAFGTDNPGPKDFAIFALSMAVCALVFFKLVKTNFFPADGWEAVVMPLVWVLWAIATGIFLWAAATGKLRNDENVGRTQRTIGILFAPLILWAAIYISLNLAGGHLYTLAAGKPYELTSTFTVTQSGVSDGTCFQAPVFSTGFLKELCFEYAPGFQTGMSITGAVTGLESAAGRTVRTFEAIPE